MTDDPARPSVTGSEDPDGEAPWAMQLAARLERDAPPSLTAVCEAAAMATVRVLADERCAPGGPWHDRVQRWWDGRIRKHARRARGAAWIAVQALDGVTVVHRGAEVRAFVPGPLDALPKAIDKLQLQGFELEDPDRVARIDPVPGGPVVVAITPDPPLPAGKAAAAAAHAAQLAREAMTDERRRAWATDGFPVVVEHPDRGRWEVLVATAPVVIRDGGFTVVAPGTCTAVARWS